MQADVGWVEQELNEVRGDCRVLKEERDEARADYALLLESSTAVADNLREDIRQLRSQLEADRAQVEAELKKQLDLMPTENHQDYDQLLESSSATIDNQRKVVALLQSRLREEREKFEAQLAELQKRLDEAERNPAPEIELSDKAGKVASFFKTLLAKDTKLIKDIKQDKDVKLPKDTISKIEEILGGGDG